MLRTLKDFNFQGKRVLLRVDFNVPLSEEGAVLDNFRIKAVIPTIKYLRDNKAKVILISHLGRPLGEQKLEYSLRPVSSALEKLLGEKIAFLDHCIGEKVEKKIKEMKPGEVILLENLRFHKGEEENDSGFAKSLAQLGDIYINEAFAASHRSHASISGLAKLLPSGIGFLMEKEIKVLSSLLEEPERPLVVVIGGKKINTKIRFIEQFLEKADYLLFGGEIANVILRVRGVLKNKPLPEKEILETLKKLDLTSKKIYLPLDGTVLSNGKVSFRSIDKEIKEGEEVLDIGPETIKVFSEIIKKAKTIFWNGPMGFFEKKEFENGTKKIAEDIAGNSSIFEVIGGGETITALDKFSLRDKFDFISSGGGAMFDYLVDGELVGIEAIKSSKLYEGTEKS